ncbi:MAG: CotH kinase family protein, partial [Sedimentisphaerales bacterium]|nr:CotH kinase family protein [Sedimentisphaerales bacterium]
MKCNFTVPVVALVAFALFVPSTDLQAQVIDWIERHNSNNTPPQIAPTPLDEDTLSYVDRTHQYNDIPILLSGVEYVMTANNDKSVSGYELDVYLNVPATVYLFIDYRVGDDNGGNPPVLGAAMPWVLDMGFVDTEQSVGIDEGGDGDIDNRFRIFRADFLSGTVTLYEQNDGGGRNMYALAVIAGSVDINLPPVVDAGSDQVLVWPTKSFVPDAGVEDDGKGDPDGTLEQAWTVLEKPAAAQVSFLPDATVVQPQITFSMPGDYRLELSATDGELSGSDDITVSLAEPDCPAGDLDGDCKVLLNDLVAFAGEWLDGTGASADLVEDGQVNFYDLDTMAEDWLDDWSGSIQVTLEPAEAVEAGVHWRLEGGNWQNSGAILSDLKPGNYTIEYQALSGWVAPSPDAIELSKKQNLSLTAIYTDMPDAPLQISEFMAINSNMTDYRPTYSLDLYTTIATVVGDEKIYPDWIELRNLTAETLSLNGWYLTDDPDKLTKWQFPDGYSIPANGYFVVYASNRRQDRYPTNYPFIDKSGHLHTNFELNGDGEYLALVMPDGLTVAHEFNPYPEQRGLLTYGIGTGGRTGYLKSVTRGTANPDVYDDVVADTKFSVDRGFYEQPVEVRISCDTSDALIRYTLDGSDPTLTNGFDFDQNSLDGIVISTTTSLRAAAFKTDWLSTNIDTHTYIFLDDVIHQATNPTTGLQEVPDGYPTSWGSVTGDYQMDPDIVDPDGLYGSQYAPTLKDDLKSVPSIVIVMNKDYWFGSSGIYINVSQDGTERACSAEFIDPTGSETGFQVNCAVRMQGGVNHDGGGTSLDRWKTYKLSMRLVFAGGYGPSKLNYHVFPDSPIERYDTFVCDAVLNHSWLHSSQHTEPRYIQDQYVADLHNEMGSYSPHGRYIHLYINNLYWGMYYLHERPDHSSVAEVFGGDKDDYDAVKHSSSNVINNGAEGSATANFSAMTSAASAAGSDPTNMVKYQTLTEKLDLDNWITYLLTNWFCGNNDWPGKNWYATNRAYPEGAWMFHSWDAEHTVENESITKNYVGLSPAGIHGNLNNSAEYRMKFADHIYKNFFNAGPLSYSRSVELYQERMNQVDRAIVGESARWGDNRSSNPHTREHWLITQQQINLTEFFPSRSQLVLDQLKNAGLYPSIDPPAFFVDGQSQQGGYVTQANTTLTMQSSETVWYTMDGTDPRALGGAAGATAISGTTQLLPYSLQIKTRSRSGSTWSALNEAVFAVGPVKESLRVTEIMYRPG